MIERESTRRYCVNRCEIFIAGARDAFIGANFQRYMFDFNSTHCHSGLRSLSFNGVWMPGPVIAFVNTLHFASTTLVNLLA